MRIVVLLMVGLAQEGKDRPMEWRQVGTGILAGIEEKKRGWLFFADAKEYAAFRKAHPGAKPGEKMADEIKPLPDFDFSRNDLLLIWSGTMARTLEIVAVRPEGVEVYERMPATDEDRMARMWGAGRYLLLGFPRTGKAIGVRWSADPPPWRRVSAGLLTGIEDGRRDSAHIGDARTYAEFRAKHVRNTSRSKREHSTEPLPDFDLTKGDLVVIWGGTMHRTVAVLAVQNGEVVAQETYPSYNENEVARMLNVGTYVMIAVPRIGRPYRIRWTK